MNLLEHLVDVNGVRFLSLVFPLAREVANLTERKIHIHPYMVSRNLSDCLLPNSSPIISGLAEKNGLNFFLTSIIGYRGVDS